MTLESQGNIGSSNQAKNPHIMMSTIIKYTLALTIGRTSLS